MCVVSINVCVCVCVSKHEWKPYRHNKCLELVVLINKHAFPQGEVDVTDEKKKKKGLKI